MSLRKFFPQVCAAVALLCLLTSAAAAQESRPRTATSTGTDARGAVRLENEPYVVSEAPAEEFTIPTPHTTKLKPAGLNLALMSAIEQRLGVPYSMGAEGPSRYDCSGFVWSVFQQAGVTFDRGSARHFWTNFAPASDDEKFKFGTLVFFNHLGHVGIVADEYGFYHASTSRGVVYSPFNEYWTRRIVGFRRVQPAAPEATTIARADTATR
jgi:cell wall-associated NlpC family hydrolase